MIRSMNRRVLLASYGWIAVGLGLGLSALNSQATATGYRFLRAKDIPFLKALIPAVVGVDHRANPTKVEAAVRRFDEVLESLSPANFSDVRFGLDLLTLPLARMALGLWQPWEAATRQEIAAFLETQLQRPLLLLRHGIQGLCQLATYAWYGDPEACREIGYPGVPDTIRQYISR